MRRRRRIAASEGAGIGSIERHELPRREFKRKIDGAGRVGESADGDEIDPGKGDVANSGKGDTAAGLEPDGGRAAQLNGFAHPSGGHIIQENNVDARDGEKGADLVQRIGFDFYFDPGMVTAEELKLMGKDTGPESGISGEMIVLDHDHVIEPETVILAASSADGGFLEEAKTRSGFAGVEDDRRGPCDGVHEAAGKSGDGGEALKEIEGNALGGEDGADGAGELEGCLSGDEALTVGGNALDGKGGIDPAEDFRGSIDAGCNCGIF